MSEPDQYKNSPCFFFLKKKGLLLFDWVHCFFRGFSLQVGHVVDTQELKGSKVNTSQHVWTKNKTNKQTKCFLLSLRQASTHSILICRSISLRNSSYYVIWRQLADENLALQYTYWGHILWTKSQHWIWQDDKIQYLKLGPF